MIIMPEQIRVFDIQSTLLAVGVIQLLFDHVTVHTAAVQ